jgi:PAS domain-containing protein
MLSIAGAFDAMTTDQVYRGALSRERSLQELFRASGTQFDPELTRDFANMLEERPEMLHECVLDRWLQQLKNNANASNSFLGRTFVPSTSSVPEGISVNGEHARFEQEEVAGGTSIGPHSTRMAFYETLSNQLRDGVAFTDRDGQILFWNDSMAFMTRVAASACVGKHWAPEIMRLQSTDPGEVENCPIQDCLDRQIMVTRSMRLLGLESSEKSEAKSRGKSSNGGREVLVQVAPVHKQFGGGAVVILRDVSDRAEMQHQIKSLHKKATSDPLTGAANRAEFDQRLLNCTTKAMQQGVTFSLIMCDIDHFKKVNDARGRCGRGGWFVP